MDIKRKIKRMITEWKRKHHKLTLQEIFELQREERIASEAPLLAEIERLKKKLEKRKPPYGAVEQGEVPTVEDGDR